METNDAKREALEAFLHGYIEGKICAPGNYPSTESLEYLHSVVKKAEDALAQDMCHTTKLTLDEAIAHAASCADNTPCGQNHKQLAEWLKEFKALKNGDIAKLRESFVTIQKIISAHANKDAKFCITLIAEVAWAALNK